MSAHKVTDQAIKTWTEEPVHMTKVSSPLGATARVSPPIVRRYAYYYCCLIHTMHTNTHTHRYIYIHIYIYVCVFCSRNQDIEFEFVLIIRYSYVLKPQDRVMKKWMTLNFGRISNFRIHQHALNHQITIFTVQPLTPSWEPYVLRLWSRYTYNH